MRYSTEPNAWTFAKAYGLFIFVLKNIGKNLISKYSQNLLDQSKKSAADVEKIIIFN